MVLKFKGIYVITGEWITYDIKTAIWLSLATRAIPKTLNSNHIEAAKALMLFAKFHLDITKNDTEIVWLLADSGASSAVVCKGPL